MTKKIVLLSRISTSAQSLESQTKDLIAEANKLGYSKENQIIIESVESAIKLSEAERIGIQQLKQAIENDADIDCVICWEPSRLSRQQQMLYSLRDYLYNKRIQLIVLNPYMKLLTDDRTKIDNTSNIVFSLFATISENEMMLKKERFMRAKTMLTKQGKKSAGAVIFGYKKDADKNCVPHPLHSKIVIDLFQHYTNDANASLYSTYKYAAAKYPEIFPMMEYRKAQHKMRHILETKIYAEGNWCYPTLISKDLFDKCQEKRSNAQHQARHQSKIELLGRGKVYCKHCGRMMTGVGGVTKAYCCSTDKLHNMTVSTKVIDYLIWEEALTIANLNSYMSNNTKVTEVTNEIKEKKSLIESYNRMLSEIEQKEQRLIDIYIDGRVSESVFNAKSSEITSSKTKVTNDINALENGIKSLELVLESTDVATQKLSTINYDAISDFETKKELVNKYISKVLVEKVERSVYNIEFTYVAGTFAIQHGVYRYIAKNQRSQLYRINADGTEDRLM